MGHRGSCRGAEPSLRLEALLQVVDVHVCWQDASHHLLGCHLMRPAPCHIGDSARYGVSSLGGHSPQIRLRTDCGFAGL